jgi:hypothetical protein
MKTYLYNRISSGKQIVGDGLSRQSESEEVLDFIKVHKLQIEKRLVYVGSSFTGKNFNNDTVLGKFMADIKTGNISVPVCLCFENWDRFGRDVEWKNTKRFLDLIHAGVSIGVVSMNIVIDQKLLAENSSILQLVVNDIQRARKESQRKSGFSKRNLLKKVTMAKAGERIYFGGQSPRWIKGVSDGKWVTDDGMIADIKRIFELYLAGNSCVGIAKILNTEKKTRFGVSKKSASTKASKSFWYNTTIKNILTNKSLTGWCKINDFESENFYPKVIDATTFERAQIRVEKNAVNCRGAEPISATSLFKGLLFCECCGNDVGVRYHTVGKGVYSYMGCRKSQVKLCEDTTNWKTAAFELKFFYEVLEQSPDELLAKPAVKSDSTLGKLTVELAKVNSAIRRVSDMISSPDFEGMDMAELKSNLTKLNQQRNQIKEYIRKEESAQMAVQTNPVSVLKLKELFNKSKSTVREVNDNMELETEKIVLISEKKYRATVAADQARIGELLKDKSVRLQLKQIMPDLVKRVVLDLKGRRFTVSMINGATQTLKMR